MPIPFAAAAAMPLLAGGGGLTAGAAGAAGAAGMFSGLGGALAGGGMALGGLGSMIGGLTGGGSQGDFSSLYAAQLSPGQTRLSIAGQELAQMMAPYVRGLNLATNFQGQQAYDQFNQAINKEQMQSGLQAGIASQYASNVLGNEDLAAKARTSTELLGPETASKLTNLYAQGVSQLQNTGLQSETTLLNPTVQAQATAGLQANLARNQLASDIAKTNLNIQTMQEDTRNRLALQRGQVEGQRVVQKEQFGGQLALQRGQLESQLALKRFGAGLALAGHRSFA